MDLVFFDEVKSQPRFPYYLIGGLCIPEQLLHEVEDKVNDLSEDVFGDRCLGKNTEFHATDLYSGKNLFYKITEIEELIRIYSTLIGLVMHEQIGRILIRINKEDIYADRPVSNIAFMYFCERTNRYLLSKKEIGILIGDRENDAVAERASKSLSEYRDKTTEFKHGLQIKNIFESVHFTPSHLSRFLQLADFYIWTVQFRMKNRDSTTLKDKAFLDTASEYNFDRFPNRYKFWPNK
jgi:hypothetical protein